MTIPAYHGSDPYVFVCYAHADSDVVFAELEWLSSQGINVWYDEGITPGEEWTDELSSAIAGATHFLYFVSPASAASRHCRNEVQYAVNQDRRCVVVHLQEAELPGGLELLIGPSQAIFNYRDDDPRNKLLTALTNETVRPSIRRTRRNRPGGLVIGLAVAVVATFFVLIWWRPNAPATDASEGVIAPVELAIAVLPFRSISATTEGASFARGVHNDVLSHLFRIGEIVVMSALAVEQFADTRPRDIGRDLRVSHVLAGSVQNAANAVRVSVELIDTATERPIWSEQYDRELADIFGIQSEIALSVANQLSIKLSDELVDEIGDVPTESIEAFRLVQRARATDDPERQIELLEAALVIDPQYVEPHRRISATLRQSQPSWPKVRERAEQHAKAAMEFGPTEPAAHWEMAEVLLRDNAFAEAAPFYRRAVELAPNNILYISSLAVNLGLGGKSIEAMPLTEQVRRRRGNFDPLPLRAFLAGDVDGYRAGIQRDIDRWLNMVPGSRDCTGDPWCTLTTSAAYRGYQLALHYQLLGDHVSMVRYLYEAREMRRPTIAVAINVPRALAFEFFRLDDHEATDRWLEYLERDRLDSTIALSKARMLRLRGDLPALVGHAARWQTQDPEIAAMLEPSIRRTRIQAEADPQKRQALELEEWQRLQARLRQFNGDERAMLKSGGVGTLLFWTTLAMQFDPLAADRAGRALVEEYIDEISRGVHGLNLLYENFATVAVGFALQGDVDNAVQQLRQAEQFGWRGLGFIGRREVLFSRIAHDPRFLEIIERIDAKNAADIATLKARYPYTRDPLMAPPSGL